MVLQDIFLFNGTVADNIVTVAGCFLRHSKAAKSSAHEFITQMPEGYDTVIGEGVKLPADKSSAYPCQGRSSKYACFDT